MCTNNSQVSDDGATLEVRAKPKNNFRYIVYFIIYNLNKTMYISEIKKLFKIVNDELLINNFFHGHHQG
jgi:hypothetical protein